MFNGRGYVIGGDTLFVYNVTDDGFEPVYSVKSIRTHGGMAMDISHVDIDGNVYIYMLPYSPTKGTSLHIFSDRPGQTEGKEVMYYDLVPAQFGSQAVRAGPNGELIWYNDRGFLYCVSVLESSGKDYSFFVNDRSNNRGTWMSATGSDVFDAVESIDGNVVKIVDGKPTLDSTLESELYLYYWSEKFNRWESVYDVMDDIRTPIYVLSVSRPNASEVWYYEDADGSTYGYTIKEIPSANIPSGTVFTNVKPSAAKDIILDQEALYLLKNGKAQLTAEITPSTGADSRIVWTSSNTSVITVDQDGNIRAAGKGVAYVTASSYSDPSVSIRCYVTVAETEAEVSVKGLTLVDGILYMNVYGTNRINAIIEPTNATDKSLLFVSSDPDVVEVDSNGNINALKIGTAVITVTSVWNPFLTAECVVNVVSYQTSVTDVSLNHTEATLDVGETIRLTATVNPTNATNKDVSWRSSNSSVAMIDGNGNVVAVSPGNAVIYVTTADGGKMAACIISVQGNATQDVLVMNQNSLSLNVGGTGVLTASLSSGEMAGKTIRWSSGNSAVAVVDSNGTVTAVGKGTAVITATLMSGQTTLTSVSCAVTVNETSSVEEGSSVSTEIINGTNGQIAETHVRPSTMGDSARISSGNLKDIISQIEEAKKTAGSGLASAVIMDIGSARQVVIPSPSNLASVGASIKVISADGVVEIPNSVLKGMVSGKVGDLTITIGSADRNELIRDHRERVGVDDVIVEFTAHVGSTAVHQFNGEVKISIPHTIPKDASIDDMYVWHLKDDGTADDMEFTYKNGHILISSDHFSHFSIGYAQNGENNGVDIYAVAILLAIIAILAIAALLITRRLREEKA